MSGIEEVAGAAAVAGGAMWVASKVGEAATDAWGQNRPDWMRGTGVFAKTQAVGEFVGTLGGVVLGFCGFGK